MRGGRAPVRLLDLATRADTPWYHIDYVPDRDTTYRSLPPMHTLVFALLQLHALVTVTRTSLSEALSSCETTEVSLVCTDIGCWLVIARAPTAQGVHRLIMCNLFML